MKKILTVFGLSAFFICMTAFYHNWTLHTDIRTNESGAVANTVGRDTEQPYIPENSSTWGDLYRHFDSRLKNCRKEMRKVQLDDIPLERTDDLTGGSGNSTQAYLYLED